MKKTILIVALIVFALGVFGVGAAFAQDDTPPVGRWGMMGNGTAGPMHTFMVTEFAEALDLNVNDINTRLAAGESMYEIAISAGASADEFPVLMTEVRANAVAAAVKANVITQEQADWMLSHGTGMGYGNCTGTGPQGYYGNGRMGNGYSRGMMNGWSAGQQTNP